MAAGEDQGALRELINRIELTFGRDLHAWLACFARPIVVVTPTATLSLPDDAAAETQFRPMFEGLATRGFDSTSADAVTIRQIHEDLALVDAAFTRRRADGSVLERVGALYVCRRADDEWRVATLIAHPADVDALPR